MSPSPNLPSFKTIRFSCPHCGALAHQYWARTRATWLEKDELPRRVDPEKLAKFIEEQAKLPKEKRYTDSHFFDEWAELMKGRVFRSAFREDPYSYEIYNLDLSRCDSCDEICIWLQDKLIYPALGPGLFANADMPASVKKLFQEAGAVFSTSPRAAAALLRLALQVLLKELGEGGDNINSDINNLFEKGLSPDLAKVMHSLRIIGNESVHPGVISVDDDPDIAGAMFGLINQIVEQLITRPREHEELWQMLPEAKRKPVEDQLQKKK